MEKCKRVLQDVVFGESMTITVGDYTFNGPYSSPDSLHNQGGVYVIHCYRDEKYYRVDVGESGEIRDRVKNHDRKDCWEENCSGELRYSELLTPGKTQEERMAIEKTIRDERELLCGDK